MNETEAEGAEKVVLGKFETAAGEVLGDTGMRVRGEARQVGGHIQEAAGAVQETLEHAAERAKAALATAGDAYGRVSGAARGMAREIEDRPYRAVGVAAVAGLLLGLLLWGRGPKIIYVKPRQ